MSLVPVFEIGVWNAWIFIVIYNLFMPALMRIHKGTLKDSMKLYGEANRKAYYVTFVLLILAAIYSIFLPLRLATIWFYVGLPVYVVGLVTILVAFMTFVNTPLDKVPATTGLYRYSRHPMYVAQLVMFTGASVVSASWLFLLLTILYTVFSLVYAGTEEDLCLEKYGDTYRDYMNRTPKLLGIPKS